MRRFVTLPGTSGQALLEGQAIGRQVGVGAWHPGAPSASRGGHHPPRRFALYALRRTEAVQCAKGGILTEDAASPLHPSPSTLFRAPALTRRAGVSCPCINNRVGPSTSSEVPVCEAFAPRRAEHPALTPDPRRLGEARVLRPPKARSSPNVTGSAGPGSKSPTGPKESQGSRAADSSWTIPHIQGGMSQGR